MKLTYLPLILFGVIALFPVSWRNCVKLVLILVVVEGALRKWVLPGASNVIYFFKDGVVLLAYVKYWISRPRWEEGSPDQKLLKGFILAAVVICGAQAGNFSLGSPIVGLFGARNYLMYLPLMFLVRDLFRDTDEMTRFFCWYSALLIPVFFLAVIQHLSPPDSPFNIYARTEEVGTALVGKYVRVTGTFSYIAGYAAYLQTMIGMLLPLLVVHLSTVWKWVVRVSFVMCVASSFLTGSRAPVMALVMFLAGYFILNNTLRYLRLYTRLIMPVVICSLALFMFFVPQMEALFERAKGGRDIAPRLAETFTKPVDTLQYAGFFGYGAGATYQATPMIREAFDLPDGEVIPVYTETEPQRVMFELGPFGAAIWYGLRLLIIAVLWRTYQGAQTPLLREYSLAIFLVHLISLPGQMVFQVTFMVYYWFLAGFVYLVPHMDKQIARQNRGPQLSEPWPMMPTEYASRPI